MMNTNLKFERSGMVSREFTTSFEGDICRKMGTVRSVTTEGVDLVSGAAAAIQECLDDTFGKTAHDIWLEIDRKAYELKDDIVSVLGRRFQPPSPPKPIFPKE